MNKLAGWALRALASVAILSYLLWHVRGSDPDTFLRLLSGDLRWGRLLLAWSCFAASLIVGWIRWWVLVNAFGVPVALPRVLRLGVLSYMLDFVALGAAGSDVVRAVLLARDQHRQRVAAISSVFADRAVGLLSLLTLTAIAVHASGASVYPSAIRPVLPLLAALTAGAWLGVASLLWFGDALLMKLGAVTRAGRISDVIARVREVLKFARPHAAQVGSALALCPIITLLQIIGFFLIASALPGEAPTFGEQTATVPLALLGGVVPLPADNLGLLDLTLSYLYAAVSAGRVSVGQGLLTVMAFRVVGVVMTAVGALIYLRRSVVETSSLD